MARLTYRIPQGPPSIDVDSADFCYHHLCDTDADLPTAARLGDSAIVDGDAAGDLRGVANLSADITVTGTGLSTSNVGAAVWAAVAAANDVAGTMGEKLNDAGSAANPWTEVIESGYTAAEIMRILVAVAAGKTTIDASGSPVIVTFRDLDDTKDRIVGEAVDSERTSVTLDPT